MVVVVVVVVVDVVVVVEVIPKCCYKISCAKFWLPYQQLL